MRFNVLKFYFRFELSEQLCVNLTQLFSVRFRSLRHVHGDNILTRRTRTLDIYKSVMHFNSVALRTERWRCIIDTRKDGAKLRKWDVCSLSPLSCHVSACLEVGRRRKSSVWASIRVHRTV